MVKKGQFWVVIRVVKKGQFWVVIRMVKKFSVVIRWLKRSRLG